ncbi:hypothetical protein [Denitromonas sp.]|uniref:hypothetical protein n=1 Tax=Denitromonas sp. TaxID=2734609 RepID=UPI003A8B8D1D
MVASIAKCAMFAGDPQQLAPIVQSDDLSTQAILGKTAFDVFKDAPSVFLNEQSRMCQGVCDIVSHTFYGGELIVCRKAARDPEWKRVRSPWYLDGREIPRVLIDDRAGDPDPTSAGTSGDAGLWAGSIAAVGMAANPLGAHQAGSSFRRPRGRACGCVKLRACRAVARLGTLVSD